MHVSFFIEVLFYLPLWPLWRLCGCCRTVTGRRCTGRRKPRLGFAFRCRCCWRRCAIGWPSENIWAAAVGMNGGLPGCFLNLFRRPFGLFHPFGAAEKFVGRGGTAQGVVFVELDEGFHAVAAAEVPRRCAGIFYWGGWFSVPRSFSLPYALLSESSISMLSRMLFGQFFAAYPRAFMHITFAFFAAFGGYMGKFFKAVFVNDEVPAVRIVPGAEALRMRIDVGGLRGGNGQA